MFEASLVESSPLLQTRNRWPALLSFAIQAVIVATLVMVPLLHPELLPFATPNLTVVAPPRLTPTPPPPVVQPLRLSAATATTVPASPTQAPRIDTRAFSNDAPPVDSPILAVGINLGSNAPSPLSSLSSVGPRSASVVPGPPAAGPAASPLHVSTGVVAGLLVEPFRPVYPAIARMTRTEGTVIVQAVISKTGRIESARAVSGPAMLQSAALNAVRTGRYRPYLLSGQPIEVETTISIVFRMGE
jgi:protein TonB